MKRFLTLFALPLVLVACDTQPVGVDTPDAQFAKGDKPGKPPKPGSGELIIFTGDLEGNQEVAGCCPNAGPFPEYSMTFSGIFPPEMAGEHTGNIFMNGWAPKGPEDYGDYIVQFWWEEETDCCYFIEMKGGEAQSNKKTKVTTVTFDQDNIVEWTIWHNTTVLQTEPPEEVNFTLTRAPTG